MDELPYTVPTAAVLDAREARQRGEDYALTHTHLMLNYGMSSGQAHAVIEQAEPGARRGREADPAIAATRVQQVTDAADMLAAGTSHRQLARRLSAKYSLTPEELEAVIEAAYAAMGDRGLVSPRARRDQYREALLALFQDARASSDDPKFASIALGALDRLIKLDSADAPAKSTLEVTAPGGDEAIRARLADLLGDPELLARVRERFS